MTEHKESGGKRRDMRTPLNRVRGLGSAHEGTDHFWRQRVTAVSNIPLILFFIGLMVSLYGAGFGETRASLANPWIGLPFLAVLLSALIHMRIGMQVIIEDYIHGSAKIPLLLLNTFFPIAVGLASAVALLLIMLGN